MNERTTMGFYGVTPPNPNNPFVTVHIRNPYDGGQTLRSNSRTFSFHEVVKQWDPFQKDYLVYETFASLADEGF